MFKTSEESEPQQPQSMDHYSSTPVVKMQSKGILKKTVRNSKNQESPIDGLLDLAESSSSQEIVYEKSSASSRYGPEFEKADPDDRDNHYRFLRHIDHVPDAV